jgi:hypothetical protein
MFTDGEIVQVMIGIVQRPISLTRRDREMDQEYNLKDCGFHDWAGVRGRQGTRFQKNQKMKVGNNDNRIRCSGATAIWSNQVSQLVQIRRQSESLTAEPGESRRPLYLPAKVF